MFIWRHFSLVLLARDIIIVMMMTMKVQKNSYHRVGSLTVGLCDIWINSCWLYFLPLSCWCWVQHSHKCLNPTLTLTSWISSKWACLDVLIVMMCVCWFTDRVQSAVATLQHSYPHQDVHRWVDTCGLGRHGAQGCQLVREGGESQPARPACKIHHCVYLVPAFFTVTQTNLRVCVCFCRCGTCMVCSSPTTQTWGVFWQTTALKVTPSGRTSPSQDTSKWVVPATRALSVAASFIQTHECVIHFHPPNINEVVLAGCQWDRQDEICAQTLKLCWILFIHSLIYFFSSCW